MKPTFNGHIENNDNFNPLLYDLIDTNQSPTRLSEVGHFQTSARVTMRSGSPSLTDIVGPISHVRKVPDSDIGQTIRSPRQRGREAPAATQDQGPWLS
jgi:hypothetical protein